MTKVSTLMQEQNRLIKGPSGFNYQVTTNVIHDRIHQGVMYQATVFDQAVPNTGMVMLLIRPDPTLEVHARFEVAVGGDSIARLYKGATFSAPGTILSTENRNQLSSNTALAVLNEGPTITDPGTELIPGGLFIPGGSGFFTSGSVDAFFNEWMLAPGEVYYGEVENISGTTNPMQIQMDFYEPIELLA